MTLTVEIITPERKLASIQADHVTLPAFDGQFGVRSGHAAYVVLLGEGLLEIKSDARTNSQYALKGGVAQIQRDTIYVLAESVVATEEISESKLHKRFTDLDAAMYEDELARTKAKAEAQWIATQLRSAGKSVPEAQNLK